MLAGCDVEEMSPEQARKVGELAGRADHDDVVDVTVVEGAARRGDRAVVTSDGNHIAKVARSAARRLRVELI
ncbi:MAG TPA: hypothetical protein VFW24_07155 [Acidimicrobiales bacterium]|nr:hypothetical protein [Acidimicrobiales bacterium]